MACSGDPTLTAPRAALAIMLAWVAAAATSSPASRARAQVVVVTSSTADQDVARQLGQLIDVPVLSRPAPEQRSRGQLLLEAASWPEPYVVIIDRQDDMVEVWRPRDHTALSRVLAADVMVDSQYAIALATAELLEWLGVLPAADGVPDQHAQKVMPPPPAQEAEVLAAPPDASALGWAAGADLELATNPGFDLSLVRPSLSVELQTGRARASPWFALGARFGAPASWDRRLDGAALELGAERVEYADWQAALHAGIGVGAGRASLLAQLEGGLSLASVEAVTRSGERVGDYTGVSAWLGLGLGLRYPLASALSLAAAVQGQLRLAPARYRFDGVKLLEEGPIGVVTRLGLIWESALLP
jgi:hypothetical protein